MTKPKTEGRRRLVLS